jgi:acylphosphatase
MSADKTELSAVRAHVSGRVQGVYFRYFVLEKAQTLGLTGWVRNLPDGAVEVEAEGQKFDLEQLLEALREGPSLAHVEKIAVDWRPPTQRYSVFSIR